MSDTPLPAPPAPVRLARTPRSGELSTGWRLAVAALWTAVILALAGVWNTSVQLGLSTWWLGPRGDPQPLFVQLSIFVAPLLMLIGTLLQVRWLGWFGLAAGGVIVGYGIVDLGYVVSLGIVEILIGAGAASVSLASLTGTYRPTDEAGE